MHILLSIEELLIDGIDSLFGFSHCKGHVRKLHQNHGHLGRTRAREWGSGSGTDFS